MSGFHFEDPDLKSSTLEIRFQSSAIEKDNFIDAQGKHIRSQGKQGVLVSVLVAKGPYC